MLRKLIFMRHAEAQMIQYGKPDKDRAITMDGMHQLDSLRQKLHGKLADVDFVLCSNARRTRQTLDGIKSLLPSKAEIVFDDALYNSSQETIWQKIGDTAEKCKGILIIAHNPGLSQAVQWIADVNGKNIRILPTGGVAVCQTKSKWNELSAPKLALDEIIVP